MEEKDAQWKEPPTAFIDLWNAACGIWGRYNPSTGFFELNGLKDITYEQALSIYDFGAIDSYETAGRYMNDQKSIRTNLPRKVLSKMSYRRQGFLGENFSSLPCEVINLEYYQGEDPNGFVLDNRIGTETFSISDYGIYFPFAQKIIGKINLDLFNDNRIQLNPITAPRLEDVEIINTKVDLRLSFCNSLNLNSLDFMVDHATNTNPISIFLNKKVYGNLTDDLLLKAANKNITFAVI